MLRALSHLAGAVLVGGGLSLACGAHTTAATSGSCGDDRLVHAYAQVRTGMPVSRLGALGFDIAGGERLSITALMGRFLPKDRIAIDALDPAVKNCYLGSDDCTAYIFDAYTHQTVLLVQGGRVTWKMMSDYMVA